MNDAPAPWWGEQLTNIPTIKAVQRQVERIVANKYRGWQDADQADLVSVVMEKYLRKFGKDDSHLDKDKNGEPVLPIAWIRTVVQTSAIDLHDKQQRRPVDPVDFDDASRDNKWEAIDALRELRTPSLMSARGIAAERALTALAVAHPADRDLLQWRVIDDEDLTTIADRTGKTYEATKKAVQRAEIRLRKVIEDDDSLREALLDRP